MRRTHPVLTSPQTPSPQTPSPQVPGPFPLTSPAGIGVFMNLLACGPSTRAEIAARLGISAAAVTKAVRPLLSIGMLSEPRLPRTTAAAGRPIQPLHVESDWGFFAGAKFTADEIVVAIVDLTGVTRATNRVPLESADPGKAATRLAEVLQSLCAEVAITVDD